MADSQSLQSPTTAKALEPNLLFDRTQEEQKHKTPPTSFFGTLKHIGPGLILAGGCVGSGELIATTSTGGKAGISLLWLIIFGCVIKVLVQIEFARYTIFSGRATMAAFNMLPGPRMPYCCGTEAEEKRNSRGHFLIWVWLIVLVLVAFTVLAGMLGGVGQALSMWIPITSAGAQHKAFTDQHTRWIIEDTQRPNNSSTLHTYQSMQTLWQRNDGPQTLLNGEKRFVELCQSHKESECEDALLSIDVQILTQKLGGRRSARDNGADVNTNNATQFFISLGTWPSAAIDDILWSFFTVVVTSIILFVGRYKFVQHFSAVLVLAFTAVSVVNLVMLQSDPMWRLSWSDIWYGLSFHLSAPPAQKQESEADSHATLSMAMSTFGVIGVAAGEIVMYPYWCVEKGYAKFTGTKPVPPSTSTALDDDQIQKTKLVCIQKGEDEAVALAQWEKSDRAWADRARGWIRVLYWDAWLAMFLYTFSTVAFYLMGAAILHRTGLEPRGTQMIRYLAVMYEPIFGAAARVLFIIGAISVLYSSLFINAAAAGPMLQDALVQIKVWNSAVNETAKRKRIRLLSALLAWLPLIVTVTRSDPRSLILFGGLLSSAFLPFIAVAALYFYFVGVDDDRLKPQRSVRWLWSTLLCLSAALICLSGVYACWVTLF